MTEIHGGVAPGYEPVRDAFAANFETHGDVGAAFALYHRGEPVVDLWGGVADADTGRPWEGDTLQLVFSTTKGMTAICAHLLAQRGELDLDAPVVQYWPEFGAAGKQDVPVRWLLSHRTGVPVIEPSPSPAEVFDWDTATKLLAEQEPVWEPGTAHGYHALTFGWLVGEIVRRVSGRSVGAFFRDEVAGPLDAEVWIGLPEQEEPRVARLITGGFGAAQQVDVDLDALPESIRDIVRAYTDPDSLVNRALNVTTPAIDWNSREAHAAEIPAANGIGTARGLARIYAACVGAVDGVRILSDDQVADATVEQSDGPDRVLLVPTRFGSGFFLPSSFATLGGPRSFGHAGAGGSLAFADPDSQVGFAYVMNKMQQNLAGDPRTLGLIAAVNACTAA